MNNRLYLRIRKRNQPGWLMYMLVVFPFSFAFFNELLHVPHAFRYLLDVCWVLLVGYMVYFRGYISFGKIRGLLLWVGLFLATTFMVYLFRFQSAAYYFWGLRNNFRLYAAFAAFAVFMTHEEAEAYLKLFDKLFWFNAVVSLVQYFGFGLLQDHLGGIFGAQKGSNGYTNLFFLIVVSRSAVRYLDKQESAWPFLLKCGTALLIAALAELKFFFVGFLAVMAMAVLFTDFSPRKLFLVLAGSVGALLGAALLSAVFLKGEAWFNVESLLGMLTDERGYTATGDLNRFTAIPRISSYLMDSWDQKMFGLGLGNCDTSKAPLFNTPFFQRYGHLHYSWMSHAFVYLECGWIGLVLYTGFFVIAFFRIRKIEDQSTGVVRSHCRIGRIMAVLCVMVMIYNSTLRTEAGYMVSFTLALPFMKDSKGMGK